METKLIAMLFKEKKLPPFEIKVTGEKTTVFYFLDYSHFGKCTVDELKAFVQARSKNVMKGNDFKKKLNAKKAKDGEECLILQSHNLKSEMIIFNVDNYVDMEIINETLQNPNSNEETTIENNNEVEEVEEMVMEVYPNVSVYYEPLKMKEINKTYNNNIEKCFPHIMLHKQQTLQPELLIACSNKLQINILQRLEVHMKKKVSEKKKTLGTLFY